jgi:integrase
MTVLTLDRKNVTKLPEGNYRDRELTGFGLLVRRDTGGTIRRTYYVQYRFGNQQRKFKIGDATLMGVDQARKKAREVLAEVELGTDPAAEKDAARAASAITFKTVVDQYLDLKELQLRNDSLRASSLSVTRLYLAKGDYFRPLHAKPISAVTRADVATRLNAITVSHSANTAKQCRKHLSAFFTWAMKEGLCGPNPVAQTNEPQGNGPRERVLDDRELAVIWNACKDDDFGRIVRLMILTGARPDEIGAACWSWIDHNADDGKGTFTIPSTVTKNKRQLVLPLIGMMRDTLASIPPMLNRDFIFGIRAHGYTNFQVAKGQFKDGLKPWQLRDIRRSVGTGMAKIGIPPHIISELLNHVSGGHRSSITGKVYISRQAYAADMRSAAQRWSDHIAQITGQNVVQLPVRA